MDDIRGLVSDEIRLGSAANGRWHTEYLGCAYRSAVHDALSLVERPPRAVLKTDLWNECLGGGRDILGHLRVHGAFALFGVDRSLGVCAIARRNVAGAFVVQADITALPFRASSFDAVLDLSTIDHTGEEGMAAAIGEYRRTLRVGGVLLAVFWKRNLVTRLRVLSKRLLGMREKLDQRYFSRSRVRAALGAGLAVVREYAVGLLLVPPHRLTGRLLAPLAAERVTRLVARVVRLEQSDPPRPFLRWLAGLSGLVAIRRRSPGES